MSTEDRRQEHYVALYFKVFAALLVLTVVTVAATRLNLAVPLAIVLALAIAAVKGSLVASIFMHLVHERPAVFFALLLTAVLLTALIALPVLTMVDSIGAASAPGPEASPASAAKER